MRHAEHSKWAQGSSSAKEGPRLPQTEQHNSGIDDSKLWNPGVFVPWGYSNDMSGWSKGSLRDKGSARDSVWEKEAGYGT